MGPQVAEEILLQLNLQLAGLRVAVSPIDSVPNCHLSLAVTCHLDFIPQGKSAHPETVYDTIREFLEQCRSENEFFIGKFTKEAKWRLLDTVVIGIFDVTKELKHMTLGWTRDVEDGLASLSLLS